MTDTSALHEEAMAAAEAGDAARRAGSHDAAGTHFARAMELEGQAAEAERTQPSRSILFRSAAWLALEAGETAEAERLAASGLADRDVPERVRTELRAVAEEARMRLVHALPPPSAESSVAVHLEGPGVGFGVADPADLVNRANALTTILYRSAEHLKQEPFRRRGLPSPAIREQVQPRLEILAASVVVRVRLGGPQAAMWDENVRLVGHVQRCFAAVAAADEAALASLIPDPLYRQNFEALVGRLAPDGERVSSVDVLGSSTGRSLAPVRLVRPSQTSRGSGASGDEVTEFVGEIRAVDETARKDTIKLVLDDGDTRTFEVHEAVMEDIVRPFYGQRVEVRGRSKGRNRWVLVGEPVLAERAEPAPHPRGNEAPGDR